MNKKLLFTLLFLVTLAFVPLANATVTTLLVNDSELNINGWQAISSGSINGFGRMFQGNGEYLFKVSFYIKNTSAVVTYPARAYLVNATSMTAISDVGPVETSGQITLQPDGAEWVTFSFANTTDLVNGQFYGVCWVINGSTSGTLSAGYDAMTSNEGVYHAGSALDVWSNTNNVQLTKIYTVDTLGGGGEDEEEEPETPTINPTDYEGLINNFVEFIVPVIVIMLPAALLCFVTRRVDKWLILIGLTIGVGLGYYFAMVPLWVVFLVVIGLIGMAYQSVRSGG